MNFKRYRPTGQNSFKGTFWVLSALILFFLSTLLTAGQKSRPFAFSGVRMDLETHTELERISTSELMGNGNFARYAISVRDPLDFQTGFTTKLTRRLPNLWKMTLPSDFDMRSLQVEYALVSATGKWDTLSAVEDTRSEIKAQLFPTPPQVTQSTREFKVIEGGLILSLEVSEAYLSGSYQGTLNVSIYGL